MRLRAGASNSLQTNNQLYCLNHIRATDASKGTPVEYANAHNLKVKDLDQWTDNLFIERL